MQCPQCHEDNDADLRFCESCGAKLSRRCASCGHELKPQAVLRQVRRGALRHRRGTPPGRVGEGGARIGFTAALAPHEVPDGERKTVTALFADIKGSTELLEDLDPDEARRIVDPALQRMMEAVHR